MIPELGNMCYEDRLKSLNLPSLSYRRLRCDAIETFKYLNAWYILWTVPYWYHLVSPLEVWLHEDTASSFEKETARSQWEQNVVGFRIVNFWNDLQEHLVTADSVIIFKNRFDKHCLHLGFCTDIEDLLKKRWWLCPWSSVGRLPAYGRLKKKMMIMMMMFGDLAMTDL